MDSSSFISHKRSGLLQFSDTYTDNMPSLDSGSSTPASFDYPYTPSPYSNGAFSDYRWNNSLQIPESPPLHRPQDNLDMNAESSLTRPVNHSWNTSEMAAFAQDCVSTSHPLLPQSQLEGLRRPLLHHDERALFASDHRDQHSHVRPDYESVFQPHPQNTQRYNESSDETVLKHVSNAVDCLKDFQCDDLGPTHNDRQVLLADHRPLTSALEDHELQRTVDNSDDDCEISEPYAKLIWRALIGAPGHGMVLKEIYTWFAENTDKARRGGGKGWQNSIRHNLSMNGVSFLFYSNGKVQSDVSQAFKKIDLPSNSESKKSSATWVLEDWAVKDGVKSTTRYRKPPSRRVHRSENPAPQRQRSGAKGGRAARKFARHRRSTQHVLPYRPQLTAPSIEFAGVEEGKYSDPSDSLPVTPEVGSWPYFHSIPSSANRPSPIDGDTFNYLDVLGCNPEDPINALYYDPPASALFPGLTE